MDIELWTIDSSKSSNLQTTAGGPNGEQAELELKELEAEELWPVINEEDKKKRKTKVTAPVRGRVFLMMFQPSCLEDLLKTHAFCNFAIHSCGNVNVMI